MAINNYIYSFNDLKNTAWTFYKNNFQDVVIDEKILFGKNSIEFNITGDNGFFEIVDSNNNHYTNCINLYMEFASNTHILTGFRIMYLYFTEQGEKNADIIELDKLPKTITFNEKIVDVYASGMLRSVLLAQLLTFLDTSSILIKKWNFGDIFNAKEELNRIEYNTSKFNPSDFKIYDCLDEINEYTSYVNYNSINIYDNVLKVGDILKNGDNYATITGFSNEINPQNVTFSVSAGILEGNTGEEYVAITNETGTNIYIKEIRNSIANNGNKNEWLDNITKYKNYTKLFYPEQLSYPNDVELIYSVNNVDYTKTTKGEILSAYKVKAQSIDNIAINDDYNISSLSDLKDTTWKFYKSSFQDVTVDVEFWVGEHLMDFNSTGHDDFCEIIDNSGNHYTNCVEFTLDFTPNAPHILTAFNIVNYNRITSQYDTIELTELPRTITFNERVVNIDAGGIPQSEILSQLLAFLNASAKKWDGGKTYEYVNVRYILFPTNLTFKTDWQYEDIPTLEDISRIVGNINTILQTLIIPITIRYQDPLTSTFLNSVENALETIAKKLKEG